MHRARYIYRTGIQVREVESLLAKGNKNRTLKGTDKHGKRQVQNVCENVVNTKRGQKSINITKNCDASTSKNKTQMKSFGQCQDIPSNVSPSGDQAGIVNPEVTESIKQTPLVDSSLSPDHNANLNRPQNNNSASVINKINKQKTMAKDTCATINHNDSALLYDISDAGVVDKFVNTMTSQKVNDILSGKVDIECNIFKQWRAQSDFNFGFVPLSDFISVENKAQGPEIHCPFALYKHVKSSGIPNFLKSRIPVQTQLNAKQWENVLQGYWDTQLLDLLKYSFPLDFNRDVPLK